MMCMNITWDTQVSELYHYDDIDYIDLDPDEVIHWRYIKREKLPNGKWRYYYHQTELNKLGQDVDKTQRLSGIAALDVMKARTAYEAASKKERSAWYRHQATKGTANRIKSYDAWGIVKSNAIKAEKKLSKAERSYEKASKLARRTATKYKFKKVTSFPARTISKGIVAVANWLSGAGK